MEETTSTYPLSITELLHKLYDAGGSDLYLVAGSAPALRVSGDISSVGDMPMTPAHVQEMLFSIMDQRQRESFLETNESNFAYSIRGMSRFRVNAFVQRNSMAVVARLIHSVIPSFESLGLPDTLRDIAMSKRGLVIMVGATGAGKSTTLASMIDYRNEHSAGHIISIEDPIEFIYSHKRSLVTQREVGTDTESFSVALKNSLRQAPDVIMIGEVRDREIMEHALAFAETGHLCLATLHANNTNQALDRIINFFPPEKRVQILLDLSLNVRALVSQRLLRSLDGSGRCAAIEILLNSPLMSDLILAGNVHDMKDLMKRSQRIGMQTFDQALFDLAEADRISMADALRNADAANDLRLRFKLEGKNPEKLDSIDLGAAEPDNNSAINQPAQETPAAVSVPMEFGLEALHEEVPSEPSDEDNSHYSENYGEVSPSELVEDEDDDDDWGEMR